MAKGIRITVTSFKEVREFRKDDVRIKIWTGTNWAYLCWWPYTPYMADLCGQTPHANPVTVEFLPPDVVPHDRLVYLRDVLPKFRNSGVIL